MKKILYLVIALVSISVYSCQKDNSVRKATDSSLSRSKFRRDTTPPGAAASRLIIQKDTTPPGK